MKPGKLRDRLIEGRAMAELSRVLVQLKEDCELPMALDDFKLEHVPKEPLAAFLDRARLHQPAQAARRRQRQPRAADRAQPGEAGHRRRRRRARRQPPGPARMPAGRPLGLRMRADARAARALGRARLRRARGGDRHRDQQPRRDARRTGRGQPRARAERRLLHPARPRRQRHVRRDSREQIDKAAALAALKPLLESDAVLKVGQNIKYDINILARATASTSRRSTTR